MQVHPGELTTVMYEFQNMQNRRMSAQAIPSYAPLRRVTRNGLRGHAAVLHVLKLISPWRFARVHSARA